MRLLQLPLLAVIAFAAACATGASQREGGVPKVAERDIVPGHVYDVEQVTTPPRPVNNRQIGWLLQREYPPALRDAGIGGMVSAILVIDENGSVVAAEINRRSGHPDLDAATLRVVRALNFRPAQIGSTAVRVRAEQPVRWTIRSTRQRTPRQR